MLLSPFTPQCFVFCLLCSFFLFFFFVLHGAKVLYRMGALWIILFCFELSGVLEGKHFHAHI